MKELTLHDGSITQIDDNEFEWASKNKWYNLGGYAVKFEGQRTLSLAREIMGRPITGQVDHKDGNKLNNQKANLRVVTKGQNKQNSTHANNTSGYKGVSYHKRRNLWTAQIRVDYDLKHLGGFLTPEEAAKAYDKAAIEHFGIDAYINFPNHVLP